MSQEISGKTPSKERLKQMIPGPLRLPSAIKSPGRLALHLRSKMVTGLFLLVPVAITFVVLRFLFVTLDELLQPVLRTFLPIPIPGAGIIIIVILIYLAGLVGSNVIGKGVVMFVQNSIQRIPIVNSIYSTSRQLIDSFSGANSNGFKHVVMIEYPSPGLFTIGFMTGTTENELGDTLVLVYIPTAPLPNSGWIALVPMEHVIDTDLTAQAAMKMVFSAGIAGPASIKRVALPAELVPSETR
jgi:uncharacterized membrane protein